MILNKIIKTVVKEVYSMETKNIKNGETTNQNKQSTVVSSELIDIQHLPKQYKIFSSFTILSIVLGIIILVGFYLYFTLNYVSPINIALRVGNIKVTNETYNLVKATLEKNSPEISNELVCIFISDTIILSEKAKELGISVEKSEYENLIDEYGGLAERVALRNKLEKYLQENATVTEEEMKDFYEENKNAYYVVNSKFKFYAVQSDSPMPDDYIPNTDELYLQEGTLAQLQAYGIYEPSKGVFRIESDDADDMYRYIIIVDGEIEYIPYEQVKENIRNAIYIQKTEGQINNFLEEGRAVYDIQYFK